MSRRGETAELVKGGIDVARETPGPRSLMAYERPMYLEPPPSVPGRRVVTQGLPPGGGACWWCSGRLYRNKRRWHYAEIEEAGHARAVHLEECRGPDARLRPAGGVRLER